MCQDVALEGTFLVAGVFTLVAAERLFPSMNKNVLFQIRGAAKKKTRFFLGDLSQICFPTHPPQGFCEIWEIER